MSDEKEDKFSPGETEHERMSEVKQGLVADRETRDQAHGAESLVNRENEGHLVGGEDQIDSGTHSALDDAIEDHLDEAPDAGVRSFEEDIIEGQQRDARYQNETMSGDAPAFAAAANALGGALAAAGAALGQQGDGAQWRSATEGDKAFIEEKHRTEPTLNEDGNMPDKEE